MGIRKTRKYLSKRYESKMFPCLILFPEFHLTNHGLNVIKKFPVYLLLFEYWWHRFRLQLLLTLFISLLIIVLSTYEIYVCLEWSSCLKFYFMFACKLCFQVGRVVDNCSPFSTQEHL